MQKQAFRNELLTRRMQVSTATRDQLSLIAQRMLVESEPFADASCIALYCPTRGEVATDLLFNVALRQRKKVCYPRVNGERMAFIEVDDLGCLSSGSFGLLEPEGGREVPVAELDLMVLPGVAFDRYGYRLGYGKGFYDRELHSAGFSGVLVGLCFGFQLLDRLPVERHDVPVDCLVTEQGFFFRSPLRGEGGSR
ncbi:MAG: 5-formyltetrahydrofolate cyclo-ligase [Desulfuromonadales bacterium]|nr:5-formyltetrahydrofolate cyclo-ligase [Desulfuromonadales bacterium]